LEDLGDVWWGYLFDANHWTSPLEPDTYRLDCGAAYQSS